MFHLSHARTWAFTACAVLVALVAGFVFGLEPTPERVFDMYLDQRSYDEATFVRDAGPPTRIVQPPDPGYVKYLCGDRPDILRVLEYDFPSQGLSGWLRRVAGRQASGMIAACVDRSARVAHKAYVQF